MRPGLGQINGTDDPRHEVGEGARLRDHIAQGLACDHLSVEGDGRHFFATIVSPAFDTREVSVPETPARCEPSPKKADAVTED